MAKINAIGNKSGELTIDPGSSGDSFVQFDINGTGEFRIGVDDDASDAFKLSQGSALGTNDTFIMTAAGERTMPLQPCFFARPSSDLTDVTGDGTVYTVAFDTEDFDQGGDYNTGTYTFTAPVTGRYLFVGNVGMEDLTSAMTNGLIYVNATSGAYRFLQQSWGASQFVSGGLFSVNGAVVVDMTASDTATLVVHILSGAKVVDISSTQYLSFFAGFLVC